MILNLIFSFIFGAGVFVAFYGILVVRADEKKGQSLLAQSAARQAQRTKVSNMPWDMGAMPVVADISTKMADAFLASSLPMRGNLETIEKMLRRSGWIYRSATDFYAAKILMALLLFAIAAIATTVLRLPTLVVAALSLGAGAYGLFFPDTEVRSTIELRRKAIFREMAWTVTRLSSLSRAGMATSQGMEAIVDRSDARRDTARPKKDAQQGVRDPNFGYVAFGQGGLFMAILREVARRIRNGDTTTHILTDIAEVCPEMLELDTFFRLLLLSEQGMPIADSLDVLASGMRSKLLNEIEDRRERGTLILVAIGAAVVTPSMLIVVGGPVLLSLSSALR